MWAELEALSGVDLVDECGLLYFGSEESPRVVSMVAALASLGVPHRVLSTRDVGEVFPRLRLRAGEVGVFTPEAGVVQAEKALRATHALAVGGGVEFIQRRADPMALGAEFDAVVLAAGAWVPDTAPTKPAVTVQTFGYAQLDLTGPVWINDDTLGYGFPADEWGAKIGFHQAGPEIHPDDTRPAADDQLAAIRELVAARFGVEDCPIVGVETCLYTSYPDEMFRMGWVGDNVLWVSACSGHGFKLGPWVGRTLAGIVEGAGIPEAFRAR